MAKVRTCMICGTIYKFCNHCQEFQREPGWRVLYHDENCKKIGDVWYAYRGKEISKEEARKAMSEIKPNIEDALKFDGSSAAKEIRAIFDVKEEKKVVEEVTPTDVNAVEEQQPKNTFDKHISKKRSSKKETTESE